MTIARSAYSAGLEELSKAWGWLVAIGLVLIGLGVMCLGTARSATTVSIIAFGWILLFGGIAWFVGAFQSRSWGGVFFYMLNALIRVATGYALLRRPDAGAIAVTMLLAVLLIVGGVFRMVAAGMIQYPRWVWTVFAGAVGVILGLTLLTDWAAASTFFLGVAIGMDMIVDGLALLAFAGAVHALYKVQTRSA
jgi:uncharacterized membrane protein HdeD (DUF308 family)